MWHSIVKLFQSYPELAIFLSLAIGYLIGKVKIGNFSLGSTTGTLLAAIFIGQMNVSIDPLIKSVFFALFIFTIGYRVGPQFFASLKSSGKVVFLSVIFCFLSLGIALVVAKLFHFDPGTAGGLLAGALTQSAVIGTTESALKGLNLSSVELVKYQSNVAVTYAVTYIIGTLFVIILIKTILPKLLKYNLKDECKKFEKSIGIKDKLSPGTFNLYKPNVFRNFNVSNESILGKSVQDFKSMFPKNINVEEIVRDQNKIPVTNQSIIQKNDKLLIAGKVSDMIKVSSVLGQEIDTLGQNDLEGQTVSIWITNKKINGLKLSDLLNQYGKDIFVLGVTRQGHDIPKLPSTLMHRGDTIEIMGSKKDVDSAAKLIGYPEIPTSKTDLVFVSLGIIFGTLVGLLSIKIGNASLGFGIGGGVLIIGLVFGWLRSFHPTFGFIPSSAQWLMQDLGLNLFIAVVGLIAGPNALASLKTAGGNVIIAGLILALTPHLISAFIGKYLMKMNPVEIVGTLCGAGTSTATLNAVRDDAKSAAPVLSYTPGYAIGNILLTVWGPVIVALIG